MSRKDNREEAKKHESEPKKKITIKLPEIKGFSKKQIISSILVVVFVVVMLCVMNYTDIGFVLNKNITDEDVTTVELIGSNNKIYSYYNEVLIADSSKLSTYNKYGRKTWELDMQGANDTKITTSGKYLQVIRIFYYSYLHHKIHPQNKVLIFYAYHFFAYQLHKYLNLMILILL